MYLAYVTLRSAPPLLSPLAVRVGSQLLCTPAEALHGGGCHLHTDPRYCSQSETHGHCSSRQKRHPPRALPSHPQHDGRATHGSTHCTGSIDTGLTCVEPKPVCTVCHAISRQGVQSLSCNCSADSRPQQAAPQNAPRAAGEHLRLRNSAMKDWCCKHCQATRHCGRASIKCTGRWRGSASETHLVRTSRQCVPPRRCLGEYQGRQGPQRRPSGWMWCPPSPSACAFNLQCGRDLRAMLPQEAG